MSLNESINNWCSEARNKLRPLTRFMLPISFYISSKNQKPSGFFLFPRGIERDQRDDVVYPGFPLMGRTGGRGVPPINQNVNKSLLIVHSVKRFWIPTPTLYRNPPTHPSIRPNPPPLKFFFIIRSLQNNVALFCYR